MQAGGFKAEGAVPCRLSVWRSDSLAEPYASVVDSHGKPFWRTMLLQEVVRLGESAGEVQARCVCLW